ncbi:MAG: heme biosynthesis HemY N-terminal domain-containing protein [Devosia sp.]|nr:heme biosynthesis HemY N-terminal domain-containing protein [Devosia sp.]
MIRLAYWIVISLLVTAGIAWFISLPGTLTLEFMGFRMQPRLGIAAALLIATIIVIILAWGILKRVIATPYYLARLARERRKDQGFVALSDGFIALQAGDAARARLLAREARANLPANAAAQLLEARADLAMGDMHSAREHYRALISNRKTALAALSGLYDQARAQGRTEAALTFAQKAVEIAPHTSWASEAVFDDLTRKGRWDEALAMVAAEPAVSREEKMRKRRRQAVVEAARAKFAEPTEPLAALDHALAALKLQSDFVPAALTAARIYINRGDSRKAMSLLRRVWRATSHPDIATLFANAVPGASAVDRLKRIRELVDTPPANKSGAMVLARACIDAYDWNAAREALANYADANPSQAVCMMLAEVEEGENGDQGKARAWVNRAVRAPRDPVWTADGITADEWEPTSPVTGRLDAFEWRVPVSAVATRVAEASLAPAALTGSRDPGSPPGTSLALPDN